MTSDTISLAHGVREPRQERGAERMAQILDAAAQLFAESGIESASMQQIAERAESSIGSLYHFFPNKQALVLAVAERCMLLSTQENASATSAEMLSAPVEQVIGQVLDGQVALQRRMPVWAVMEQAIATIPEAKPLHDRMSRVLVEQVEGFLALRVPRMSAGRRQAAARFSVAAIDGVLRLDQTLAPEVFSAVVAETKRAMVRYFEEYERAYGRAAEAGASRPPGRA